MGRREPPQEGKESALKPAGVCKGLGAKKSVQRCRVQVFGQRAEAISKDAPTHISEKTGVGEAHVREGGHRICSPSRNLRDRLVKLGLERHDLGVGEE